MDFLFQVVVLQKQQNFWLSECVHNWITMLPKSDFPVKSQIMTTETRSMNWIFSVASAVKLMKHFLCIFAWFMALSLCFHAAVYHQNSTSAPFRAVCCIKVYELWLFPGWLLSTGPFFFYFFFLSFCLCLCLFPWQHVLEAEKMSKFYHLLCKLMLSVKSFSFGLAKSHR